tara:strand:+ start:653 stop:886 length:234 start_codon:yes stop_codon:yes gene_type:complete
MSEPKSISHRFNSFHLEVSVLSGRMGWLLEKLVVDHVTDDGPGLELLQQIHLELESLIEQQDCRSEAAPLSVASEVH